MKEGPSIAAIAALIGDPARANMLTALSGGTALTATELALEAGVSKQTASAHLTKMADAKLIAVQPQGRHRYFRLADKHVADLLESLMGVAARTQLTRTRPGPKDPALRYARVCYDHLAGELGVALYEKLLAKKLIVCDSDTPLPTPRGERFFSNIGLDLGDLRQPLCRTCLDWSMRRFHLAGGLGAALLTRMTDLGWARRQRDSRVIQFTPRGKVALKETFGVG